MSNSESDLERAVRLNKAAGRRAFDGIVIRLKTEAIEDFDQLRDRALELEQANEKYKSECYRLDDAVRRYEEVLERSTRRCEEEANRVTQFYEGMSQDDLTIEEMLTSSNAEIRYVGSIAKRILAEQEALIRRRSSTFLFAGLSIMGLLTLACAIIFASAS